MRSLGLGTLLVASSLVAAPAVAQDTRRRRVAVTRAGPVRKVHAQTREIARRMRQAKRLHTKYMLNGGFTRRGNEGGGYGQWWSGLF